MRTTLRWKNFDVQWRVLSHLLRSFVCRSRHDRSGVQKISSVSVRTFFLLLIAEIWYGVTKSADGIDATRLGSILQYFFVFLNVFFFFHSCKFIIYIFFQISCDFLKIGTFPLSRTIKIGLETDQMNFCQLPDVDSMRNNRNLSIFLLIIFDTTLLYQAQSMALGII